MDHPRRSALGQALSLLLVLLLAAPPAALADRTELEPGMNLFSPDDDVKLGRDAAQEAEQQLPLLNDPEVDRYLNRLGRRLWRHAPGADYPYQIKAVNQKEINAFALPGGFLYINRGTILAAQNEAELAGVVAHEISHVALRHGTNQLSKAVLARAPLAILGGLLGGGGGLVGQLAQLGIAVGFSAVFLKFSRTAETQADVLGTQMLYDAGYHMQAMAEFFDTLQQKSRGGTVEFFSSHPNPENRQERIREEIDKLGPQREPRRDSQEFRAIKQRVLQAPEPAERDAAPSAPLGRVEPPSNRYRGYRHPDFFIRYPENWEARRSGTLVLLAPPGGARQDAIAYGVMANVVELDDPRRSLRDATEHLVRQFLQNDPNLREVDHQRTRIDRRRALVTQFSNQSPIQGEREVDYLFTAKLNGRLFYAMFIVPESDYSAYQRTFQEMVNSIRFR